MRLAFLLLVPVLGLLVSSPCRGAGQPNIVYIMADDLGIGDVGVYGQKILKTPRIDQLAVEGMKFSNHYSGSSLCAPTRSCLLTGTHTGHTRVRKNGDIPLRPEDITFGEALHAAGYVTAGIGKWGVGLEDSTGAPWKKGFDFWFGYLDQSHAHYYYPDYMWRNDQQVKYPNNREQRTRYSHDLMTEEALAFIERSAKGDQPFCLYLPYTLVHAALDVPEDSIALWRGKIEETEPYGTPGGQHYRHQPEPHAAFAGMVSRLDRDVGRVVDLVDELGLAENTLVIFTSDNGPTSAGGADPKFFDGNGPWRGIKFEFYEGGIRCPMIARWPGTIEPGSETDHISAHWDVLPTLAELGGDAAMAKVPEEIDGISFLPTLLGKADEQKQHDYLYWELSSGGGTQAIRKGDWKALCLKTRSPKNTRFELYHLASDPAEESNVAEENPEIVAEMRKLMTEARVAEEPDELYLPAVPKKKKAPAKNPKP
jgi:arylsulfatase A-like enzyme